MVRQTRVEKFLIHVCIPVAIASAIGYFIASWWMAPSIWNEIPEELYPKSWQENSFRNMSDSIEVNQTCPLTISEIQSYYDYAKKIYKTYPKMKDFMQKAAWSENAFDQSDCHAIEEIYREYSDNRYKLEMIISVRNMVSK